MDKGRNQKIKDLAVKVGQVEGHEYWVVPSPLSRGMAGYNGYVVFPKRPTHEKGYEGILNYVPVHGGITYAEEDELGMVYGFDTAHFNSENKPRNDPEWIREQCGVLTRGILKAQEVEKRYLRCITNKGKAKYAQQVLDINPKEEYNFGTMLNMLADKV